MKLSLKQILDYPTREQLYHSGCFSRCKKYHIFLSGGSSKRWHYSSQQNQDDRNYPLLPRKSKSRSRNP